MAAPLRIILLTNLCVKLTCFIIASSNELLNGDLSTHVAATPDGSLKVAISLLGDASFDQLGTSGFLVLTLV